MLFPRYKDDTKWLSDIEACIRGVILSGLCPCGKSDNFTPFQVNQIHAEISDTIIDYNFIIHLIVNEDIVFVRQTPNQVPVLSSIFFLKKSITNLSCFYIVCKVLHIVWQGETVNVFDDNKLKKRLVDDKLNVFLSLSL